MDIIFRVINAASLIMLIGYGTVLFANELNEEEALLELYGDQEIISIATGSAQPVAKAPAVATVITANEIRELGARDIDEVLETVPGLHVARNTIANAPIYTFRGVYTTDNAQVLMLINGIPITNLFVGNRNLVWGGMPVEAISRIEVIRGPGSAVYGADAFAGVINIITKDATEIDGTEFGVRYGSFNSKEGWLLHGGQYGGFDVAFIAEVKSTDGHSEDVDSDFQTIADSAAGTSVSLAPGSTSNGRDNLDLRLDIRKDLWTFRGGLQRRRNVELGFGVGSALDQNGEYESDRWNADLTYHNPQFREDLDVQMQVSFLNTSQVNDEDALLFPPGSVFVVPGLLIPIPPAFPDGIIVNPEVYERHWRFNFSTLYSGFENHAIRIGTGYNHSEIYKVKDESNLDFSGLEAMMPAFFGTLTDTTDTSLIFLPEKHRDNKFVFVQDVWSLANDWELTAGIRYDDYNDFGSTINPRLALVWSARHDLTLKALYGQAFRAPSFAEFRNQNNPVANGNDDLDPEEMETFEFAVDYRPMESIRLGMNLFYYEWDDIIRFVDGQAENTGEQHGLGGELELEWQPARTVSVIANYAYQDSEDDETNEDSGNAPNHQAYARLDWEFMPNWHVTPAINYVGERERIPGDARDEVDDYTVVDLTVRGKPLSDRWEFALGIRNLFNSSPEEPTLADFNISNDLPLERRTIFGEIRMNLH